MPKVVDHEQRRAQLAEAMWRIMHRDGIGAVSVRAVAEEAGWSAGSLRYYFATQSELMRFAMTTMLDRVTGRVLDRFAEEAGTADPLESMARVLEEGLPLDPERQIETIVLRAFRDRALYDRSLASTLLDEWVASRHLCRVVVTALGFDHEPVITGQPLSEAAEREATLLHAFWDGMTDHASRFPDAYPADSIRALLRAYLERLRDCDHL